MYKKGIITLLLLATTVQGHKDSDDIDEPASLESTDLQLSVID